LIAIAIAVPLYELLRWQVLRRARTALLRKARDYAKRHDVRVDLFKFGGKQLVREELLNDRAVARAMSAAAEAGERPTDVRERVERYIDEIVPAFSLTAYFELGMRLARAAIGSVYRPLVVLPPPRLPDAGRSVAAPQGGPARLPLAAHRGLRAVLRTGGHQLRSGAGGRGPARGAARPRASAHGGGEAARRASSALDRALARRGQRAARRRRQAAAARLRGDRLRRAGQVPRSPAVPGRRR